MRTVAILAAALFSAAACGAELRWSLAVNAENVTITVQTVTARELRRLQPESRELRVLDMDHRRGLAKLYRNRETGAWSCTIFVVDPTDTATLEHERRHCQGWTHDAL